MIERRFEKISEEQFNKDLESYENKIDYNEIILPRRSTMHSAGYDFYSPIELEIKPHEFVKVPTGIKASMNNQDVLFIIIRSSLGIKKGLRLRNQTGVVDADYYNNTDNEGHIWIVIENTEDNSYVINKNDRIAQGIFLSYNTVFEDEPLQVERQGGIGSTNK